METAQIERETERDRVQKETEEIQQQIDERRYNQALLDRKKEDERNQDKLLAAETRNTKLITDRMEKH